MKLVLKFLLVLIAEASVFAFFSYLYKHSSNEHNDFAWETVFFIINTVIFFISYKNTKNIFAVILLANSFLSVFLVNQIGEAYTSYHEKNRYSSFYFKHGRADYTLTLDNFSNSFTLHEFIVEGKGDIGVAADGGTYYYKKDTIIIQFDSLSICKIYDSVLVNFYDSKDTIRISRIKNKY